MANVIYNSFKRNIMSGGIDLDTDTIKVALVTSSYTPDQDAHDNFDDVTNEVSGTGYTARGVTLGSVTVTIANLVIEGLTWSSSIGGRRRAAKVVHRATPPTARIAARLPNGGYL